MPDNFIKDTVYIISKSARRYDVLKTQNGVIFKRRATPAVFPDYVKPKPHSNSNKVTVSKTKLKEAIKIKELQAPKVKETPVQVAPVDNLPNAPILQNSSSFEDLQRQVEELRRKEAEKKAAEAEVPVVTIEDADDLANGVVAEEQELITKDYLKSLSKKVLNKVYYVSTGKQYNKNLSKFEMRKSILEAYKEANANRKKVIYEASKDSDE